MVSRRVILRCKIYEGLILWFFCLNYLARKCIQQAGIDNLAAIKSRREFLIKNEETQNKIRQIFSPYQPFCKECQDCCSYVGLPFFHVDCLLYEIEPENPLVYTAASLRGLLRRMLLLLTPSVILDFIWYLVGRQNQEEKPLINQVEGNDDHVCPLLTKTGCGLSWGRRPVLCTIFLCKPLRREMGRRNYGLYLHIALRYMINLTTCLAKVWLELRCQKQLRTANRIPS